MARNATRESEERLWANLLEDRKQRLKAKNPDKMLQILSYETLQESLGVLQRKYSSDRVVRCLESLTPTFERLRSFGRAISLFVQSDPIYASLIWGGILLVIECACRFSNTLGKITQMFEEITNAMPRFERYMGLYPTAQRLQRALRKIYGDYLDFCIDAINFFRRRSIYHVVGCLWSRVAQRFDHTIGNIQKHTNDFHIEVDLAHQEAAARHRDEIYAVTNRLLEHHTIANVRRHPNDLDAEVDLILQEAAARYRDEIRAVIYFLLAGGRAYAQS
ncbi:MAG: hypothetical protein M1834_002553 [Cirrosporium novae-zelandiae]|nr:MAG: hypothetical protein M1834_002553 [Cirrosporium novae-zelandiae]